MPAGPVRTDVAVAIVGAGFSGLGVAIALQRAGIDDFLIIEKGSDVGGTWRENTYPGAACDIPSHLYSFSFEPNPGWSRAYSPQAEILAYLRGVTDKYGLRGKMRLQTRVSSAAFDEARGAWTLQMQGPDHDHQELSARALVLAVGALHVPLYPDIKGRTTFQGKSFHSAQWDHGYDLRGRKVGVIGTGASTVQFVPRIAPIVGSLEVFQRTPAWVMPKQDHPISPRMRGLYRRIPWLQRAMRWLQYWVRELTFILFVSDNLLTRLGARTARKHLEASIRDPDLRRRLTPSYRLGCKRILQSNDFYQALESPRSSLVTEAISEIVADGVMTADGRKHPLDAIIYGTGFHVTDSLPPFPLIGPTGVDLRTWWQRDLEAYYGISIAGFPNLFVMLGPNTGLGHNSIVFMTEAQARFTAQAISYLLKRNLRALVVKPEAQRQFNERMQKRFQGTAWAAGCQSWYLQGGNGKNVTLWPGPTFRYWLEVRTLREADFDFQHQGR